MRARVSRSSKSRRSSQFYVERISTTQFQEPRLREALASDALDDARVVAEPVTKRARDLGAQPALDSAAPATEALALGELPRRPLTDAIDDPIGMNHPQVDFTRSLPVPDGTVSTILSLLHDGYLHRPRPSGARG